MATNSHYSPTKLPADIDNDNDEETEHFLNNDKTLSIINLLTKHKIKLWELDSIEQSGDKAVGSDVETLIMKLSDESGLVEDELKQILIRLQKHSIYKFEHNKRFNTSGIAVFKLKIIGNNNKKLPRSFNEKLEVEMSMSGADLKSFIISKYDLNCDTLKMICNGKIIDETKLLSSQEIKNFSTLLVMCVYENPTIDMQDNGKSSSQDIKLIVDIKDAVNFLAESKLRNSGDDERLQIKNQNGISLDISKEDSLCLTTAMILHEKAKNLIKSKEYIKALILLAEADSEFKNCNDRNLLEQVDNYALLNLDITWCYLCLENLHELKNAEERLSLCEKSLQKCYGANLERLTKIKSDSLNKYLPVFVRLNLLKAVLNFHKGRKRECKQFLDTANSELQKVMIDEDKLTQVMSMGFSSTESRLALRASLNNVDLAIEQIFKKKQQQKESRQIEKEKTRAKQLHSKYGLTLQNKPIDIKVLNDIIQFGYTEKQAAKALIKSNNDFNLALDILQSDDVSGNKEEDEEGEDDEQLVKINEAVLNQLISMGFDAELSKLCLKAFKNNLSRSLDFFAQNKQQSSLNLSENVEFIRNKLNEIISNESLSTTSTSAAATRLKQNLDKMKHTEEFLDNLVKEIPKDEEAYLDFNLEDDAFYINKYYSLLES